MTKSIAALLCIPFLFIQADPAQQAREPIEKLRSEKIEEREEASRKLKELGKTALPHLEKAMRGPDSEAAQRAAYLLRVITLLEKLTPNLRKAFPGVEDRLAAGDDHAWTQLLLEAGRGWNDSGGRPHPTLKARDLEVLAGPALAGAKAIEEKGDVCDIVRAVRLHSAVPELVKLLKANDPNVRLVGLSGLAALEAKGAAREIAKLLREEHPTVRATAILALGEIGAKEAVGDLLLLLKEEDRSVRENAADALVMLGSKEAVPELMVRLKSKDSLARSTAVAQLAWLGAAEALPELRKLLKDGNAEVRLSAASALGKLGSMEGLEVLLGHLEGPDPRLRLSALEVLADLEPPSAAPVVAKLLADSNSEIRVAGAACLCVLGSREGVPVLFEGRHEDLFPLNALRRREAWDGLRKKAWTEAIEGTTREILDRLSKEAGLSTEWSPAALEEAGELDRLEPGWKRGRSTLLQAVQAAGAGYGIVLEKDRIRILRVDEALKVWNEWRGAELKKK